MEEGVLVRREEATSLKNVPGQKIWLTYILFISWKSILPKAGV